MIVGATLLLAFADQGSSLNVEPEDVKNTQLSILCAVLASVGFAAGGFLIKVYYTKYERTPGFDINHLIYDSNLLYGLSLISIQFCYGLEFSSHDIWVSILSFALVNTGSLLIVWATVIGNAGPVNAIGNLKSIW